MFYDKIIENVPDYKTFLTVDELDESTMKLSKKYPEAVEVFEAGKSRKGHPIYCLKIGNGPKNALAFACPHPNEPIGAMMLEYLSWALAENKDFRDELGYTWYIIKCSDPDGTKLNEGWFKGPFTIYNYARNFFRPVAFQQVEWTFPIKYKRIDFNSPIPETKAIMDIIDKTTPEFLYSLHNAGFGGAYWYISDDMPEVYDSLRNSAKKQVVPLNLGEAEAPYCKSFSPAVYRNAGSEESYDYYEELLGEVPDDMLTSGTDSSSYAKTKGNTVSLVTELPYFYDPRIEDTSEADITRKEAILKSCENSIKNVNIIIETMKGIEDYVSNDNPFKLMLDQIMQSTLPDVEAKKKWVEGGEEFTRKAKVSEAFDNIHVARVYNMLGIGMLIRASEYELEKLDASDKKNEKAIAALNEAKLKAEKELKSMSDELEKELNYSVIPIQKLVRVQLESGLIVANQINKSSK